MSKKTLGRAVAALAEPKKLRVEPMLGHNLPRFLTLTSKKTLGLGRAVAALAVPKKLV